MADRHSFARPKVVAEWGIKQLRIVHAHGGVLVVVHHFGVQGCHHDVDIQVSVACEGDQEDNAHLVEGGGLRPLDVLDGQGVIVDNLKVLDLLRGVCQGSMGDSSLTLE